MEFLHVYLQRKGGRFRTAFRVAESRATSYDGHGRYYSAVIAVDLELFFKLFLCYFQMWKILTL